MRTSPRDLEKAVVMANDFRAWLDGHGFADVGVLSTYNTADVRLPGRDLLAGEVSEGVGVALMMELARIWEAHVVPGTPNVTLETDGNDGSESIGH